MVGAMVKIRQAVAVYSILWLLLEIDFHPVIWQTINGLKVISFISEKLLISD
jgi:hypothetical protein